jgi:ABC-type multidrug transport system fused ATPase/permease subunit
VTLFPQDPEIFENTILYNITLGLPFHKEDIMKVCEAAMFVDVIQNLPHGLETHIQEKGVNLSGGQKQRLALARGILSARTSDIILLDEPTSSVDPKTEVLIYEKMFSCFSDKAIISSLHRLHLLNRFDYVYIMDQGRIVDHGTFDHLKSNSQIFQKLWAHQKSPERQDQLTL